MDDRDLIQTLKAAREEMGLSTRAVSRSLGLGHGVVSSWETGLSSPTIKNFIDWSAVLGFNVDLIGKV